MNQYAKLIPALKLSIEALEDKRRAKFAAGDAAYRQGIRNEPYSSKYANGVNFTFAEDDHKHYERYTKAIETLEDWIEVLQDPGVTYEDNADLPLFQGME